MLTFEYSVVCTVHCILNYLNTLKLFVHVYFLLVGLIAQDFHYKVSLILLSLGEKFPQYCEQVHYTVQHFNICISTEHTVLARSYCHHSMLSQSNLRTGLTGSLNRIN